MRLSSYPLQPQRSGPGLGQTRARTLLFLTLLLIVGAAFVSPAWAEEPVKLVWERRFNHQEGKLEDRLRIDDNRPAEGSWRLNGPNGLQEDESQSEGSRFFLLSDPLETTDGEWNINGAEGVEIVGAVANDVEGQPRFAGGILTTTLKDPLVLELSFPVETSVDEPGSLFLFLYDDRGNSLLPQPLTNKSPRQFKIPGDRLTNHSQVLGSVQESSGEDAWGMAFNLHLQDTAGQTRAAASSPSVQTEVGPGTQPTGATKGSSSPSRLPLLNDLEPSARTAVIALLFLVVLIVGLIALNAVWVFFKYGSDSKRGKHGSSGREQSSSDCRIPQSPAPKPNVGQNFPPGSNPLDQGGHRASPSRSSNDRETERILDLVDERMNKWIEDIQRWVPELVSSEFRKHVNQHVESGGSYGLPDHSLGYTGQSDAGALSRTGSRPQPGVRGSKGTRDSDQYDSWPRQEAVGYNVPMSAPHGASDQAIANALCEFSRTPVEIGPTGATQIEADLKNHFHYYQVSTVNIAFRSLDPAGGSYPPVLVGVESGGYHWVIPSPHYPFDLEDADEQARLSVFFQVEGQAPGGAHSEDRFRAIASKPAKVRNFAFACVVASRGTVEFRPVSS